MKTKNLIITSDNNNLISRTSNRVMIKSTIEIVGTNTELPVTIMADFNNVPEELHYQYYQTLAHQYHKDLKVYNNIHPDETVKSNIVKPWYKRLFS